MSILKRLIIAGIRLSRRSSPQHSTKQCLLLHYAEKYHLTTLVETGTYMGDMIYAMKNHFTALYSIELDHDLAVNAKKRFANHPHITILEGDSAKLLPKVLQNIKGNTLFWLDGHYSGGVTAKGDSETPIMQELKAILTSDISNCVIAIDDANLFNGGTQDYPTIDDLKKICAQSRGCELEVRDNIIILRPS